MLVFLSAKGKRKKTIGVHILTAEAFWGPRSDGIEMNHKDGNKANNRLENLEYCTKSENIRQGYRMGLIGPRSGTLNGEAVVTEEDVLAMRLRAQDGEECASLGRRYGISKTSAWRACVGLSWRHVGGPLQGRREYREAA